MRYSITLKDRLLIFVVYLLLKIIYLTSKKEFTTSQKSLDLISAGDSAVIVFWHRDQLLMPFLYAHLKKNSLNFKFMMLSSSHRDGKRIAYLLNYFGITNAFGSSSREGISSSLKLIKSLEEPSACIGITPDGPRGPVFKAKKGAISLAKAAKVKIIPVTLRASRKCVFRSWDKMFLPYPFSKLSYIIGDPFEPQDEKQLESILNQLRIDQDSF